MYNKIMKNIFKILISIAILIILIFLIVRQYDDSTVKETSREISQNENINKKIETSDREEIENLIKDLYKWTSTESIIITGFEPILDEDEIYAVGLDFETLEERNIVYKNSGYFSESFLENYRELWIILDNEIKTGRIVWNISDGIPYHSVNSNLWTLSQDFPDGAWWDNIVFNFTGLNEESATLEWGWGDTNFSSTPKKYEIELDKINGEWKISYIEGFEKQEEAIRSSVEYSINSTFSSLPRLEENFCNSILNKTHNDNFNDGYDVPEFTSPGVCEINIGEETSYIFSFENVSKSNEPDFILNIYSQNGRKIQTLPIEYSWSFNVNTINLYDDINFDGYNDILLRVFGPRAAEFTYYIYSPEKEIFEKNNTLSNIFSPTFDSAKKTITTTPDISNYYYNEAGEQKYYPKEEQTIVFEYINGKYKESEI